VIRGSAVVMMLPDGTDAFNGSMTAARRTQVSQMTKTTPRITH
jgi:hypothetical protein